MQRLVSLKLASFKPTTIPRTHPYLPRGSTPPPRAHLGGTVAVNSKPFSSYSSSGLFANVARDGLSHFRAAFRRPQPSFDHRSRNQWRSQLRNLSPDDLVLGLLIANAGIFIAWRVVDRTFMMNNFTVSIKNFKKGRIHTLVTSAFSHIDTSHIIHNMIGLYFFGTHLSKVFGAEFLLKLYLAGGVAGSVCYLVHSAYLASSLKDPSTRPGLGASGAVNAIILLDIFLHPRSTLLFNFFIPVPAALLGIYLIGTDVLEMIEGNTPGSAHLGGAAVAAVAWVRLRKGRF